MSGRRFAYAGVVVGLVVSVWANVAHASTAPAKAPAGWPTGKPWNPEKWHPETGAVVLAGFWPLILFLSLEVLTRTTWRRGKAVLVARAGVAVVAAVAAVTSYLHLHGLLTHYGEQSLPAALGPLAIDGLMGVSAAALLADAGRQAPTAVVTVTGVADHPEPPSVVPEAVSGSLADDLLPTVETPQQTPVPALAPARRRPPTAKPAGRAARSAPARRGRAELEAELLKALADGSLPAAPSAEAIRKHLRCGIETARQLRDLAACAPAEVGTH